MFSINFVLVLLHNLLRNYTTKSGLVSTWSSLICIYMSVVGSIYTNITELIDCSHLYVHYLLKMQSRSLYHPCVQTSMTKD